MTLSHNERCQYEANKMLNRLLRTYKHPREYKAVTYLETYLSAPAFSLLNKRELIERAYAVHHLPSPYDLDAWEDSAPPTRERQSQ